MTFHFVLSLLHSFPFDTPLVLQPSTWLLFPLPSTNTASCSLDPQSPVSTVSPSFGLQLNIRCRNFGIPVAVLTTTGVFSCLVELQPGPADIFYEAREGLVQLLHHHCSPCPNTPLGWYVPHVFIVSVVGCAPSSYQWVPVIVGPYISNFCYFKLLLLSLIICMISRLQSSAYMRRWCRRLRRCIE